MSRVPPGREPSPIHPADRYDARLGRAQQAATAIALLAGFVFHADWMIPIWTLVLGVDALAGPRLGPLGRLFVLATAGRLGPARVTHESVRLRTNALPEVVVLLVASGLYVLGLAALGWALALVVAAAAAYSAVTDACVGCEVHRWRNRAR